jgi:glycosyltransferase involved in cell wall biosynthesis
MRILMLGWEFPPVISGGLGTACGGLTGGLDRARVHVLFLLPRPAGGAEPSSRSRHRDVHDTLPGRRGFSVPGRRRIDRVIFEAVSSALTHPYRPGIASRHEVAECPRDASSVRVVGVGDRGDYDGDLTEKIRSYAERCVALARREPFDVIHAHNWMTYPAAMALSQLSGRPIVAHVHATEMDRSGDPTGLVYDIERRGMEAAARILAVSNRTRDTVVDHYHVPSHKVTVVHNGIDHIKLPVVRTHNQHPTVLFMGRITRQKGPRFFIRAAARVAAEISDARFVVAGAGDQMESTRALTRELGIADRVTFTGFLRGDDVNRAYDNADVYVMPSISEPFGLSALEAASRGVPVIVSRTSGVAEVLEHGSLKVDYQDVRRMARKIIDVLTQPALAGALRSAGVLESAAATWDAAARRCIQAYYDVTASSSPPAVV